MAEGTKTSRRVALVGAAAALLVPRAAAAARSYEPLFRIERNKNANIVQYDAVLESAEKLDPRGPVVSYWILHAKNGEREGLGSLDRRAYGFSARPEPGGSWLLYLNATSDRAIRVLRWRGRWLAQVLIARRSAILDRIYVMADNSGLIPSVRWVDLFGTDMVTGLALTERLKP